MGGTIYFCVYNFLCVFRAVGSGIVTNRPTAPKDGPPKPPQKYEINQIAGFEPYRRWKTCRLESYSYNFRRLSSEPTKGAPNDTPPHPSSLGVLTPSEISYYTLLVTVPTLIMVPTRGWYL